MQICHPWGAPGIRPDSASHVCSGTKAHVTRAKGVSSATFRMTMGKCERSDHPRKHGICWSNTVSKSSTSRRRKLQGLTIDIITP
mmetsp:Transcript_45240/g.82873  ORF Transcript_45240/g.82873 Transcript_45240/m.82873 type:complete len:85 (-) Transcript_45240:21-275(-)